MKSATTLTAGLLLLLAGVAAPVAAQDAGDAEATVIQMRAVTEGSEHFFEKDGEKNPTLNLEAGKTYTIELEVVGTHNIHIGAPVNQKTDVISTGSQSLTFTVPEDAPSTMEYWCDPHQFMGMAGTIQVSGGTGGTDAGDANETGNDATGGNSTDDGSAGTGDTATGSDGADATEEEATNDTPSPGVLAALAAAGVTALAFRARRGGR